MPNGAAIAISGAVEGIVDEAVLRRLLDETSIVAGPIRIGPGKPRILSGLPGYNNAARFSPWIVLLDLNGVGCAPEYVSELLSKPAAHMHLRIAVRQVEAWLLADSAHLSQYLGVRAAQIPSD